MWCCTEHYTLYSKVFFNDLFSQFTPMMEIEDLTIIQSKDNVPSPLCI